MKMIDVRKFPPKFMQDSMDRCVFNPEPPYDFATEEQVRALLGDAEYYSDPWGPDAPWLKSSAKATVKACKKALGIE